MILAIIESKSAGIVSPSLTPVSTRMPGPAGSWSSLIRPGAGAKSRSGSSALSRASTACPVSAGMSPPLQLAAARGHVQLGLDQVQVGGHLGDRVLDLQAGVDLEERELLVPGVVEELHRGRAAVVHGQREPLGGRLELRRLGRAQHRRRRLLDDLLVAALHRAVADAERPGACPGRRRSPAPRRAARRSRAAPGRRRRCRRRAGASRLVRSKASVSSSAELTIRMPRPPPPAVALSISG